MTLISYIRGDFMKVFAHLDKVDKHDFKKVLSSKPVEEANQEEIDNFKKYHRECMIAHNFIPCKKKVISN